MAFTSGAVWEVQTGGLDDFYTVSAVVTVPGSGYADGDTLTLVGGTSTTAATFRANVVATVLTSVTPINTGHYTVLPANPVSVTGGGGTLATLTVTWNAGGNGGGFDTGVAGFPTDGAATVANTAVPVFTSASYNFVAGDVGAWIYIKSGSNWIAGWYKIVSVGSNAATLDAAVGHAVLATGGLNTVAGCATVASPTSGTWGCDYSQSATPILSFSDLAIDGTTNTKFTSAANPVGKNFVGNIINVTDGVNFTVQRVAVVSTVTTTATCDKALGTVSSTGGIGNMGGALGSPGQAAALKVASNTIFQKTGTYLITTASPNVPGGIIVLNAATGNSLIGYGIVRFDDTSPPTIQVVNDGSVVSITMVNIAYGQLWNVILDGNSQTGIRGVNGGDGSIAYRVTGRNCKNNAFNQSVYYRCTATGCATQPAFNGGSAILCEAYSNTVAGFNATSASFCISRSNSGAGSDGFAVGGGKMVVNCVAYANGRYGFNVGAGYGGLAVNCIATGNTDVGFKFVNQGNMAINCASFGNSAGATSGLSLLDKLFAIGLILLFASPFVDAAAGNFVLNNNNPGGAQLRASGIPGLFPEELTQGYLDIGAAQHADPVAGPHGSASS